MTKMINFHLTITIFNAFFEKKLDVRWKIDSVRFYNYDLLMWKILNELSYSELNKFRFNLFEWFKHELTCINVSQFVDGEVYDWYSIVSQNFNVSSNIIANCIPNRKVRDKYFEWDWLREKFHVRSNFLFHINDKWRF